LEGLRRPAFRSRGRWRLGGKGEEKMVSCKAGMVCPAIPGGFAKTCSLFPWNPGGERQMTPLLGFVAPFVIEAVCTAGSSGSARCKTARWIRPAALYMASAWDGVMMPVRYRVFQIQGHRGFICQALVSWACCLVDSLADPVALSMQLISLIKKLLLRALVLANGPRDSASTRLSLLME